MADDAREIGSRFRDEQEYIERYVRLLRAKSTLHDRQVQDLNRILKRVHVDQLPVRRYERTGEAYSPEELTRLLKAIRQAEPEVYQTILGHEQGLDAIPSFGLDGPAAEYMDRLDEWIDYFADRLSDDPEEDDTEGMLQYALREAEKVEEEHEEEDRISPEPLKACFPRRWIMPSTAGCVAGWTRWSTPVSSSRRSRYWSGWPHPARRSTSCGRGSCC